MYSFNWESLVSEELLDELLRECCDVTENDRSHLRDGVALILKRIGGPPIVETPLTDAQENQLPRMLLEQVIRASLARSEPLRRNGLAARPTNVMARLSADRRATPHSTLGKGLAALVRRSIATSEIRKSRRPIPRAPSQREIKQLSPIEKVTRLLVRAPVRPIDWRGLAQTPEPSQTASIPRMDARQIDVLTDRAYYASLPALIASAKISIRLCMFHIVYDSESHPTRKLLDALVAARRRGVEVTVLLDQDRPQDPYRSLIINSPASAFFKKNDIECWLDDSRFLLHSKYLVIDGSVTIIGSHNWSAGSYFTYRDVSFVVHSEAFGEAMLERFRSQWERAREALHNATRSAN